MQAACIQTTTFNSALERGEGAALKAEGEKEGGGGREDGRDGKGREGRGGGAGYETRSTSYYHAAVGIESFIQIGRL